MWFVTLAFITSVLSVLQTVTGVENKCFRLDGSNDSYIVFENTHGISAGFHFKLKFRTSGSDQIVYYNEGTSNENVPRDYEGVFIRNGYLNYFGFNPAPYGVGESFGGYARTDFVVNTDTWIELEFFRNKNKTVDDFGLQKVIMVTGIKVNGNEFLSKGGLLASMDLGSDLWVGGHENIQRISKNLSPFAGDIKDFYDVRHNIKFDTPVDGEGKYEEGTCIDVPPPA